MTLPVLCTLLEILVFNVKSRAMNGCQKPNSLFRDVYSDKNSWYLLLMAKIVLCMALTTKIIYNSFAPANQRTAKQSHALQGAVLSYSPSHRLLIVT